MGRRRGVPMSSNNRRRRPPPTRRSPTPGRVPKSRRPSTRVTGKVGGRPERAATSSGPPKGVGGEQIEGRQAVRELLMAGSRRINEVLVSADADDRPILEEILELARSRRVLVREISRSKLRDLARTEAPQGVVAKAAPLHDHEVLDLCTPVGGTPPFLLALDGVTDPGNLGALLRTAECAGVTGVILPRHRAANVTPAVAKAAAGAVEHLRIAMVGGLPTALATLRDADVWTLGFDAGGRHGLFDPLAAMTDAVCVVLGAEGAGLSRLVRERCDEIVSIPLAGQLDSLNVSTAGALALFEVVRARSTR